tara:strand:+ start:368 stop:1183 length:816 start_codon:yes stop_codon:yes gene_type:complete
MDLRSLRYFCAAAELGSLTAAAEHCHVAQPSISNAVAQLEFEFTLRLFSRSKKGVVLTPEGQHFYQAATQLLSNAEQMAQRFKRPTLASLSLGISHQLASRDSGYLLQLVANNLQDYRLQVRVNPTSPPDLWITSARQAPKGYGFITLLEQEYQLLLPRGWPVSHPLDLNEALDYSWIDRLDCELRAAFISHVPGLAERCTLQVDTEDLALSLVQHRQGATVMAVSDDIDELIPAIQHFSLSGLIPEDLRLRQLGLAYSPGLEQTISHAFN